MELPIRPKGWLIRFKVDPGRLQYRAAGINHITWFTHLVIDGEDVYPQLMDKLRETGMDKEEPISADRSVYGPLSAPVIGM